MNHVVDSGTPLHHLHHSQPFDHSELPLLDADADECSGRVDAHSPRLVQRHRSSLTNTDETGRSLLGDSNNNNNNNNNSSEGRGYRTPPAHPHTLPHHHSRPAMNNVANNVHSAAANNLSNNNSNNNNNNNNNGSLLLLSTSLSQSLPDAMTLAETAAAEGGGGGGGGAAEKPLLRRLSLGQLERNGGPAGAAWPRLVAKNGECMVRPIHNQNPYLSMYRNWFHLLIEYSWRSVIAVFAAGFVFSWVFFGLIYYLIVYLSGDIQRRPEHRQCIANVHSMLGAVLFSMESQQTIGYGSRYMTEECPPAFVTLTIQIVVGLLLQTMLAGIVVAKVLRPKKRKQEMRFSQRAVIGPIDEEDKRPTLMVRIADIQQKLYLAESHVRMYMARTRINYRGEKELVGFRDMNVGYDSGWDRVLLLWPIVIRHIIDCDSPLFGLTPEDMDRSDFEIIMTVEGIVEATGATFQARTSFLPWEIEWGRRFTPLVTLNAKTAEYEVDYGLFDVTDTVAGYVPRVSAEIKDELERLEADEDEEHKFHNKSGFT